MDSGGEGAGGGVLGPRPRKPPASRDVPDGPQLAGDGRTTAKRVFTQQQTGVKLARARVARAPFKDVERQHMPASEADLARVRKITAERDAEARALGTTLARLQKARAPAREAAAAAALRARIPPGSSCSGVTVEQQQKSARALADLRASTDRIKATGRSEGPRRGSTARLLPQLPVAGRGFDELADVQLGTLRDTCEYMDVIGQHLTAAGPTPGARANFGDDEGWVDHLPSGGTLIFTAVRGITLPNFQVDHLTLQQKIARAAAFPVDGLVKGWDGEGCPAWVFPGTPPHLLNYVFVEDTHGKLKPAPGAILPAFSATLLAVSVVGAEGKGFDPDIFEVIPFDGAPAASSSGMRPVEAMQWTLEVAELCKPANWSDKLLKHVRPAKAGGAYMHNYCWQMLMGAARHWLLGLETPFPVTRAKAYGSALMVTGEGRFCPWGQA